MFVSEHSGIDCKLRRILRNLAQPLVALALQEHRFRNNQPCLRDMKKMVCRVRAKLVVDRISVAETGWTRIGNLVPQDPAYWLAHPNCSTVEPQIVWRELRLLQAAVADMVVQGHMATAVEAAASYYIANSKNTTEIVVVVAVAAAVLAILGDILTDTVADCFVAAAHTAALEHIHNLRLLDSDLLHPPKTLVLETARTMAVLVYISPRHSLLLHLLDFRCKLDLSGSLTAHIASSDGRLLPYHQFGHVVFLPTAYRRPMSDAP